MVIAILLLLLLFLAGFLNVYFYLPPKKLYAWLRSFSFKNKNISSSTPIKVVPTAALDSEKDKAKASSENYDSNKKDELRSVFATFDKNGDGFITRQELRDSLENIRIIMTEKEVEEMVTKVDSNGDGLIDFEEFCLLCESMAMPSSDQERESFEGKDQEAGGDLQEAFDVFDRDKDGLISVEELGLVLSSLGLREGRRVEDCKAMIKKVDMDGDGMVNFDEFKKMMRSRTLHAHAFTDF
ncbi:calmodulin-like protein 3 [Ricinus communis]|uniref:Calmodulin, putative n=1 Tax=Ricinus communis TaxID=3988 RepID=B9SME7_RICCO|nr:calmodulin-like protein 3 [Ricinus communis]EEF35179.1 Calmodulin, putative [Ricinus communis]|eukprot:XP_002527166.1 calmodulin-like protein 3 [Ricinus communis]